MDDIKRAKLVNLGQRAVDYYLDTGLCLFCDADDVAGRPHEDCNVGEISGVTVDAARAELKASQRELVARMLGATDSADRGGQ